MNLTSQSASGRAQIEDALRIIVGADHVRRHDSQLNVEPASEHEVASVLRVANDHGLSVVPRGNATKASWANAPRKTDIVLSTLRLNSVLEHAWADLTVTVESGCTIAELQKVLAQHGQRLAIDPLWPERTTVGGLISSNDSGIYRLRFGSVRDLIIGITLALPNATIARSGGKVVKNVAGYDLPKLATGAMGTLGIITRAVFRLHPLPQNQRTLTIFCDQLEQAQHLILQIQGYKFAHVALQLRCDCQSGSAELDILFEGAEAGIAAQKQQLQQLVAPAEAQTSSEHVWQARQTLWADQNAAIAKLSVLPADISRAIQLLQQLSASNSCDWQAVVQATGIGSVRISSATPESIHIVLGALRSALERESGSLVLQRPSPNLPHFDLWGSTSDAHALMAAVKHRFDPNRTLNPGTFVGGI